MRETLEKTNDRLDQVLKEYGRIQAEHLQAMSEREKLFETISLLHCSFLKKLRLSPSSFFNGASVHPIISLNQKEWKLFLGLDQTFLAAQNLPLDEVFLVLFTKDKLFQTSRFNGYAEDNWQNQKRINSKLRIGKKMVLNGIEPLAAALLAQRSNQLS